MKYVNEVLAITQWWSVFLIRTLSHRLQPKMVTVWIVCVENATLVELLDIAKEIFSTVKLPEGSVLMFGSISHMGRSGTSIYASEWVSVIAQANSLWRGSQIGPLIPLIISECPGSVKRSLWTLKLAWDHMWRWHEGNARVLGERGWGHGECLHGLGGPHGHVQTRTPYEST
jgi:hypothetical protein